MQEHSKVPLCSVIIPSLGRGEALNQCLESLHAQTYKNFEIIIETEEGDLARIRNQAARRARGEYLVFIDDDVICEPGWLSSIVDTFQRNAALGGVSGTSHIDYAHRRTRDIFRYKWAKSFYDKFFCDGLSHLPGHITKAGAWTTGASEKDCAYSGPVDFLEACNMAWEAKAFLKAGGFDERYKGVGDWSEPDLAYRIREMGYGLWFNSEARLEHQPSRSGAFKKRAKDSPNRFANYERFSKEWIEPCLKHTLYKLFIRGYYAFKTLK